MQALVSRLLGFLPWGLGAALAAASLFAWVQTSRLGSTQETVQALKVSITALEDRVLADSVSIAQRDALIEKQNAAVRSLVDQQAADRTAYLAQLAQADKRAKALQAQATDIMHRTTDAADTLGRCEAALGLAEEVVGKE